MRDGSGRFVTGNQPWNTLPDVFVKCSGCTGEFKKPKKNPSTKFCSHACWSLTVKGVPKADETKRKMSLNHSRHWLGKKQSVERAAISARSLRPYQSGELHWNWKGGITPQLISLRFTKTYKDWRTAVYKRDNYTCQMCWQRGGELNADHIVPYAQLVYEQNWDLLYDISNGRTLCIDCHRKTPTYARKFLGATA